MSSEIAPSERTPLLPTTRDNNGRGDGDDNDARITAAVAAMTTTTSVNNHDLEGQNTVVSESGITTPTTFTTTATLVERDNDKYVQQRQLVWIIVPAVSVGIYMASADQTLVFATYGLIGTEFGALNLASWIATGYVISLTAFQPLYGKMSDLFGRKACLLFAYLVFGIGGIACALAQNMEQLIVARAFQGAGGSGLTVVVSILFNDIVPLADRGVWQGVINLVSATGAASGGPLGGICADLVSWRWAFFLQGPLAMLAFVLVAYALKLPSPSPSSASSHSPATKPGDGGWQSKLKRIDFLGAVLLFLAVFTFTLGMDRGSNVSWATPMAYGPLTASVLFLAVFVVVEACVAVEPFAPGRIICTRDTLATYLCFFFNFAGWFALIYYLPLYFQVEYDMTAADAGLLLLPIIAATVVGSLGGGYLIKATSKYRTLTVTSYAMFAVSIVPIILFSGGLGGTSIPAILVGTVVAGVGNGIGGTSILIALIAAVDPADQAIATACSYLFRGFASAIGLALSSTIVQSSLRFTLHRDLTVGGPHHRDDKAINEIEKNVRQSLDYLRQLDPPTQEVVRRAYALAIRHCYVFCLVCCSVAVLCSLFIRERKLSSR